MTARKTSAPAAAGTLRGPGHHHRLARFGPHIRIAFVRTVGPRQTVRWRCGYQDRSDPFHVFPEAHVVIPLIAEVERLDAARDGVVGNGAEMRLKYRVHRIIQLEVAADPVEHLLMPLLGGRLDAVMIEHQPGA